MKRNPSDLTAAGQGKLLILSDGKPGHVNQSIAYAKHLGCAYDICRVAFRSRWAKGLSYILDRCGIRSAGLLHIAEIGEGYVAVVSAGSETYYANRVLAQRLKVKAVAIMLPKGYCLDFDLIVAQQHDNPPQKRNILSIPINLTFPQPQGVVKPVAGERYVSLIIGGHSRHGRLDVEALRRQLQQIRQLFPAHHFWLTTSRRTPPEIETLLQEYDYAEAVYFSQRQVNPIGDFLLHSDYVFLTADSTSMISEAVSAGKACVEVLPLSDNRATGGKVERFFRNLVEQGCLHIFDGRLGQARHKIDLKKTLRKACL